MKRARRRLAIVLGIGLVVAAAAALVHLSGRPPEGPVELLWDREVCAECRMHVSDPHFAAQLQTREGDVLAFDDPGCALLYLDRERPSVHALYFHHVEHDRWVPASEVAFARATNSPMGFELGAVERGTEGAISLERARESVRATALARGLGP